MRTILTLAALVCCLLSAACGDAPPSRGDGAPASSVPAKAQTPPSGSAVAPPVASSHGGDTAGASSGSAATDKPPVETPELDAKVEKAVAKAKAAAATAADRQAAAAAHMGRGNFYYNAQDKRLYRYALGDFRHALRFEPDNSEAKEKIEMIESIYRSLGRPIPNNGLEP